MLFSTLMIHQSILDSLLFLRPVSSSPSNKASHIARRTVQTLSALSFVIETFGGVASTSEDGPSFPELKRVFYMAIDIMAADAPACEELVRDLITDLNSQSGI